MTQGASASNPRTETTVSLFVWAALVTYEEIVNSTGDAPSAMWKKGENVQGSLITRKEDGWKIDSKLTRDRPLSDHINELLGRVYPKLCFLKQKGVGKIVLSAAVYIYTVLIAHRYKLMPKR